MKRGIWSACSLLVAFVFAFSAWGAEKPMKINTAWMPEHETFLIWYAKQKGWDKEEGLEIELKYFDSGMAMLEALPAKQWVLGGIGGVPMVVGALRFGAYLIAVGNDESLCNVVMVRPDSPILKQKGYNPKYPDVYGSPETIKGKTVLVTTVSSAHYVLSNWLKVFGLKDADVVIKNMDQAQAVAAFESGIGDIVALWAPHLYHGLQKGWKIAADIRSTGAALPIVLIGEKEFCDKNPEVVAKFIRIYLRGVNLIKREGVKLAADYRKFMKDWGGMDISEDVAKKEIEMHPVFDYDEQLKLFDKSKGESTVESWQRGILEFFTEQGRFKPEEKKKVEGIPYITDKFLKMVKQPIP
jgi:NitT/TauT family transport system substrate-binding protein/sulfonate transport system substrate-binding protein